MNFNSSNVEGRKLFSPWRFVVGSSCRDPRLALSAYPGDEALPKWQTSGSLTRRQYHIWAFIYLCAYYTLLEAPCPVLFLDASKHCVSLHFTQRVTTTISAWTSGGPSSRRNVGVYPMDGWYVHTIPKPKGGRIQFFRLRTSEHLKEKIINTKSSQDQLRMQEIFPYLGIVVERT